MKETRRPYKRYSEELKEQVLQELKDTQDYKEILKKHNISSTSLIYNWRRQAEIDLYRTRRRKKRQHPVTETIVAATECTHRQPTPEKAKREWPVILLMCTSILIQCAFIALYFLNR